jgi:hypothetical protein
MNSSIKSCQRCGWPVCTVTAISEEAAFWLSFGTRHMYDGYEGYPCKKKNESVSSGCTLVKCLLGRSHAHRDSSPVGFQPFQDGR